MKKLLTTTALVGLIASSVSSYAETKVQGSIEQTINFNSVGGTGAINSDNGIGQELNLTVSSSKKLTNGMDLAGAFRLEDNAIDMSSIKLTSGAVTFEIGADTGQNINSNINPRVDEIPSDVMSLSGSDSLAPYLVHDVQHIGLAFKTAVGSFAANYAPGNVSIAAGDSSISSVGGSGLEVSFAGNLGVDGLKVLLGQQTIEAANGNIATSGVAEEKERVLSFSYGQGPWAVGYTHRTLDDGTSSTVENSIDTVRAISATYAINDSLSIGYERIESEFESSLLADEKTDAITVGYNLGGLGVALMYIEAENIAGIRGAAAEQEELQIRTVYNF
jgi:hypothetical protein